MANARIDENGIRTALGTLQSDGVTTIPIQVNPATGAMKVSNGTSGTASARANAPRDENEHPAWIGMSSADMVTPVPIACDSGGNLLIQST